MPDHLPPKWFTKDPNRPLAEEIDEMLMVIRAAVASARTIQAATPFQFWQKLYAAQGKWGVAHKIPPLLAHFGTSLVERAVIDAFCRAEGVSFAIAPVAGAGARSPRFSSALIQISPLEFWLSQ